MFLSRCARAKANPREAWVGVLAWCGMGALGRAVSFWHDSGGLDLAGGVLLPTGRGATMPPAAPLARGSVDSLFDYFSVNPFRANWDDRTKSGRIRHLRKMNISVR